MNLFRVLALLTGSLAIFAGIALAALEAREAGGGGRVARRVLSHASLGLEFFVGATILNLVLNPTWAAVATTALTIVVRKPIPLSLGRSARVGQIAR